jgi:membrane-associated protein
MNIEYLLHLDQYLEPLILSWGTTIYWVIALIVFLESACILTPILPGDGLLFLLGYIAAKHGLSVDWIMGMLFIVTTIGYAINFYLGLKFGELIRPRLSKRYQGYVVQAEKYYGSVYSDHKNICPICNRSFENGPTPIFLG